jgi:hypothetical protein
VRELGQAESIELAIVAAGARRDLGELDAAVVSLQVPELDPARRDPWSARLFYAYADNLLAAGRESDALQWFVHAADVDDDGETDAGLRIAQLTGEPLPEDEFAFGEDDEPATTPDDAEALPDTDEPDAAAAEATETTEAAADDAAPIDAAKDDAAKDEAVEDEAVEDEAVEDEAETVTDADAEAADVDAGTDTVHTAADADDVDADAVDTDTEPGGRVPGGESAPADGSGADAAGAGERGPGASG